MCFPQTPTVDPVRELLMESQPDSGLHICDTVTPQKTDGAFSLPLITVLRGRRPSCRPLSGRDIGNQVALPRPDSPRGPVPIP